MDEKPSLWSSLLKSLGLEELAKNGSRLSLVFWLLGAVWFFVFLFGVVLFKQRVWPDFQALVIVSLVVVLAFVYKEFISRPNPSNENDFRSNTEEDIAAGKNGND